MIYCSEISYSIHYYVFFTLGKRGLQRIIKMRLTNSKVHNLLWWNKLFYSLLFFFNPWLIQNFTLTHPVPSEKYKVTRKQTIFPNNQWWTNLKIRRFGRFGSNPESKSVSTFGHQSNQRTESKIFGESRIPNPESESCESSPNLNFESESWNYKNPNLKIRVSNPES